MAVWIISVTSMVSGHFNFLFYVFYVSIPEFSGRVQGMQKLHRARKYYGWKHFISTLYSF